MLAAALKSMSACSISCKRKPSNRLVYNRGCTATIESITSSEQVLGKRVIAHHPKLKTTYVALTRYNTLHNEALRGPATFAARILASHPTL
jgi:hypothetical protein